MATLFNKQFRYVELKTGSYDDGGDYSHGSTVEVDKMVHGTIQSATYKEQIPAITGTRNTGNVDIYSSEALTCRTHGGNDGGYVAMVHGDQSTFAFADGSARALSAAGIADESGLNTTLNAAAAITHLMS